MVIARLTHESRSGDIMQHSSLSCFVNAGQARLDLLRARLCVTLSKGLCRLLQAQSQDRLATEPIPWPAWGEMAQASAHIPGWMHTAILSLKTDANEFLGPTAAKPTAAR